MRKGKVFQQIFNNYRLCPTILIHETDENSNIYTRLCADLEYLCM